MVDIATARAEARKAVEARKATEAKIAIARAESEKAAEEEVATFRVAIEKAIEEDFGADFFQGYEDLKRNVALDHPEWDLSALSGIDSKYWNEDVSAEEVALPVDVSTNAGGDDGQGLAIGRTKEDRVEVADPPSM